MAEWTDASSYSRNDTKRIPTVWAARSGQLRVDVHRHIHYGADAWLLSCERLGIDRHVLTSKEIAAAQREAVQIVVKAARQIAAAAEALACAPAAPSPHPPAGEEP